MRLNILLYHVHVTDEIIDDPFQIFEGFIGCFPISTTQKIVFVVSEESSACSGFHRAFVLVQFHNSVLLHWFCTAKIGRGCCNGVT